MLAMLSAVIFMSACEPSPPELVWVPAPEFAASLEVSIDPPSDGNYRVGEWIVLHAIRSTGPWQQVRHRDLPKGAKWMREPPFEREEKVEANIRWLVDPNGQCEFNLPDLRKMKARKVRFNTAGDFRLWAVSHTWGSWQVRSNVVELTIDE